MGAQHKRTPEVLDKIVQFIWNYQRLHDGVTPSMTFIGKEVGISAPFWYISILEKEGRLNRIGGVGKGMSYRAFITDHVKNKAAIRRFQNLLAKAEELEAAERERIRQEQEKLQQPKDIVHPQQGVEPRREVHAYIATVAETPKPDVTTAAPTEERTLAEAIERAGDLTRALDETNKSIKKALPKLIRMADTRDLLGELVGRGYTVSRGR